MRIDRVRLHNFKCYGDADVRLDSGVTVIHGVNGSGKSSLLEACFFALYGARALEGNLDDVVTIGTEETEIELWFSHGGGEYHLKRRIRATGERPVTAECVLEGPEATFEGARDVRARVTDLLRMDHEAFVNCAYVRQGEVNKLINASASDRQDMIDDLLQLGKLEEYRERASSARVGVGRVRDDKQGALAQVDEQIEKKTDKNLPERLNAVETELSEVAEEIERYEDNRESAAETLDEAESILAEYQDKREELSTLESDIDDLQDAVAKGERTRESLAAEISEYRERIDGHEADAEAALSETELPTDADVETVEQRLSELDERDDELGEEIQDHRLAAQQADSDAESHRTEAKRLDEQAEQKRERADELDAEIEATEEALAERRETLSELDEKMERLRDHFADAPVDVGEAETLYESVSEELDSCTTDLAELSAAIEQREAAIEDAEELLAAGKCPECGQSVEGAPHVESIDEEREALADLRERREKCEDDREELEQRLETAEALREAEQELERLRERHGTVEQLIEEKAEGLEADRERVESLRETAAEHESAAEEERAAAEEAAETAESERAAVGELNEERATLRERREVLADAIEAFEAIEAAEREIESRRERREGLAETNDERRQRLAEKRSRRTELAEAVENSSVESAREEKERAEAYLQEVEAKLEELRERQEELQTERGALTRELEELAELRERREELSATLDRLETLYEETDSLESMYASLRADLRQRNVETLERMLNDTFELVYRNASYDRIELDGDYELTIYQKDGEPLEPEQLSGGERALFNLSLRCAIYRLLAEGIEGAAPMPPLVLDEPTVFLDSGHVSQLVVLIERMRDLGVEQIIVVSHDEELVGAADDLVTVEKDPTTNRSTARRTETALPVGNDD